MFTKSVVTRSGTETPADKALDGIRCKVYGVILSEREEYTPNPPPFANRFRTYPGMPLSPVPRIIAAQSACGTKDIVSVKRRRLTCAPPCRLSKILSDADCEEDSQMQVVRGNVTSRRGLRAAGQRGGAAPSGRQFAGITTLPSGLEAKGIADQQGSRRSHIRKSGSWLE